MVWCLTCNEYIHHENKLTQMTMAIWLPLSCDVCRIQITIFHHLSLYSLHWKHDWCQSTWDHHRLLVWFALVTFSFLFSCSFLLTIAFLFLVSIVFSALQPTAFCYHLSILLPSGYFLANNDSSRKTCSTTGIVWQRRLPTNLFSLETTSNCLYCACSAVLPMQEAIISPHPSRKLIYLTFWTFPEDRIHP